MVAEIDTVPVTVNVCQYIACMQCHAGCHKFIITKKGMSAHIKLMCYIVEGIIIKFLPIDRIMHLTPTSSLC